MDFRFGSINSPQVAGMTVYTFFNSTEIRFSTIQEEKITLRIFNIHGQQVAELLNETLQPGEYSIPWNAQNETEGIYFYILQAGSYQATKKMILSR